MILTKTFNRSVFSGFIFLICQFTAVNAAALNLEDVVFSSLPGDRLEIQFVFDSAPIEPESYTINEPARIVFDFPDVLNQVNQKNFPLGLGNAKSAVILGTDNRTRFVLNLQTLEAYNTRVEENTLFVEVGNRAVGSYITEGASITEAISTHENRFNTSITDIDFRRGDEGEATIQIALNAPDVNVDVQQSASAIVVNFFQVGLPEKLRRRLDVRDFATPVSYIDANYDGSKSVITIDPNGEYDYLAYQTDTNYIISVKPLTEEELEARRQRFAYTGDKLSLNFQDIEVRSVLQLIADFTQLNLVASDTVSGRITLRLDNVPWDQALDLVLRTKGLDKRQVGNVLMVAPAAEIAERERQELETQRQLQELAPLRTEYIRIKYADAKELFELFRGEGGEGGEGGDSGSASTASILSERGSVIVDERTNSIILTDTEDRINQFLALVDQIDQPVRQVLIEARIVIADTDYRKDLGVEWGVAGVEETGEGLFEYIGSREGLDDDPGSPAGAFLGGGTVGLDETTVVDLGLTDPAGSIALGFIGADYLLDLELSALQNSGNGEIVSQPKVVTGDKQPAFIQSGTEVPFQEASSSGATTTSFKEAVLKLDVTPQITPDDNIIMSLMINQDSVGDLIPTDQGEIPTIEVTEIGTRVLVGNGQTVVLGGIFQTEESLTESKVPFFGDLPVVGRLFRQSFSMSDKRELLIFITPKILTDPLRRS